MSYDVILRKDVPFGGSVVATSHLGDQIPPPQKKTYFGGMNKLFQT